MKLINIWKQELNKYRFFKWFIHKIGFILSPSLSFRGVDTFKGDIKRRNTKRVVF